MTVHPLRRHPIRTPGQLVNALQIPFSDEQLSAITAPLEPAVIIAGAGSGKTTVMAARVVWLVGTGQVALHLPGQRGIRIEQPLQNVHGREPNALSGRFPSWLFPSSQIFSPEMFVNSGVWLFVIT